MNLKLFPLLLLALAGCRQTTAAQEAQKDMIVAPTPETKRETVLSRYLSRPEAAYKWQAVTDGEFTGGDLNLRLTSQTWQGAPWTHRLQIFKPDNVRFPDAALLNISFGSGSMPETFIGKALANATGVTVVNVFNVPNQPLFERTEDELIAYTLGKYLETGDETWPLLLPMTKSVTKTMDALGEWSQKQGGAKISRFIVTGASKRGWTTDLVAASDKRVIGAIPLVYNNLDMPSQIAHQKQIWKETSPMIAPYADAGLFDQMQTEAGQKLIGIIDPYQYRAALTMPKLLINATNDAYWPLDSLKFYRANLPGQTDLFNVPNAPHSLGENITAAIGSAAAWSRLVLEGKTAPKIDLKVTNTTIGRTFSASVQGEGRTVRLWFASSPTLDFRRATWKSIELPAQDGIYRAHVDNKVLYAQGKQAQAFAEIEIAAQPLPLRLSSDVWQGAQIEVRTMTIPRG